jgi:small subunit ribosomal protein S17
MAKKTEKQGKRSKKSKTLFGITASEPETVHDKKCPFYGDILVKKKMFTGKVVSTKSQRTTTISWERRCYLPKYERYEQRRTKIRAHHPPSVEAKEGDLVLIAETRPLSKTKNFVIIKKVGEDYTVKGDDVTLKQKAEKQTEEKAAEKKAEA